MTMHSYYPSFDVLTDRNEWDEHTQEIVTSRLGKSSSLQFFTPEEAERMRRISSLLVDDQSQDILDFVIDHIDQTLYQSPGEEQRKVGVPEAPQLIKDGLDAIEQGSQALHGCPFVELDSSKQKQYLQQISDKVAKPNQVWSQIPQDALFLKLLGLTVESYCSHPSVWSEIGYAGPAYPRGYVRTQIGQLDPWEAQPET